MGVPEPVARLVVEVLPAAGSLVRLSGEEAAHARARRLARGDQVVLVDGSGREASGRLVRVDRRSVELRVESVREAKPESPAPILLGIAAVRAERLAWVAEKATELGAAGLVLVVTERTQRFRAAAGVASRLGRVIREAAKQSERARWPTVRGPIALSEALAAAPPGNRLVLDPSGDGFPESLPLRPTSLLVGPEGGWTEAELDGALSSGWSVVSLAAGKLRAETAAVAALVLTRSALARSRPRGAEAFPD
jgi:16S rRNA (uracil1498-N3)-methyltransferase